MENKNEIKRNEENSIGIDDAETIKQYMEIVHRYFQEIVDYSDDGVSIKELWKDFIADFQSDNFKRGIGANTNDTVLKQKTFRDFIKAHKSGRFPALRKIAQAEEEKDSTSTIDLPLDGSDQDRVVSLIRALIRSNGSNAKDSDMLDIVLREKTKHYKRVQRLLIERIQTSVSFLEDFGIIDSRIDESNEVLESIGLSKLKFVKRNPLPDEYDKDSLKLEDIGVIDSFEKRELRELPLEELVLMTAFWESQYMMEKYKISNAIYTIDSMGKFGEKQFDKENTDLDICIQDLFYLQNLILQMLKTKQLRVKNWGRLKDAGYDDSGTIIIAIDAPSFRGPVTMSIEKEILEKYIGIKEEDLPSFNGYIDEDYSKVMSSILVPRNKFFNTVTKKYKSNQKEINADKRRARLLSSISRGNSIRQGTER